MLKHLLAPKINNTHNLFDWKEALKRHGSFF